MQQAQDFRAESQALFDLLDKADPAQFDQPTQFKHWTINAVLQHLHFWNQMAGLQLTDEPLLLYFTSGTTAKPKLVQHTHVSYPVGHLSTLYWIGLQPGDLHWNISSPGWGVRI